MTIYKYLDVSTANITRKDAFILYGKQKSIPDFTTIAPYEYGVFIGVPRDPEYFFEEARTTWELREAFCGLLKYAREQACDVIRLDCDADPITELQTFDW